MTAFVSYLKLVCIDFRFECTDGGLSRVAVTKKTDADSSKQIIPNSWAVAILTPFMALLLAIIMKLKELISVTEKSGQPPTRYIAAPVTWTL